MDQMLQRPDGLHFQPCVGGVGMLAQSFEDTGVNDGLRK